MPTKQPETMPTPEEILEVGERLAGMLARVWPNVPQPMHDVVAIRKIVKRAELAVRTKAASSRSPG